MGEAIIVALITAGASILATFLTVSSGTKKTEKMIEINQAVQETKIEELTREVRQHNHFAEKIPLIEAKTESLEKRVDRLEERSA